MYLIYSNKTIKIAYLKGNMKVACIYIIRSKIKPEKFYIGSAVNLLMRKQRHIYTLKSRNHKNSILQNHVNKYGIADIFFEIMEVVDNKNDLIEREQFYIDTLKPYFNICKIAGSSIGTKRNDETKKKLSNWRKKYHGEKHPLFGTHRSEETKLKLRTANLGKKQSIVTKAKMKSSSNRLSPYKNGISEETKLKMSEAKKGVFDGGKSYKAVKVINIATNEIYDCIKDAAEKNNILPSTLRSQLNKPGRVYLNLKKTA